MKYVVRIDNAGQYDKWFYSEKSESFVNRTLKVENATIFATKEAALKKANELYLATNKQRDYWIAEINKNNEIINDFIFK